MSFFEIMEELKALDFDSIMAGVSSSDVQRTLQKDVLLQQDFINLLSPAAAEHMEAMAQRAQRTTIQYFGRTIGLYIPLYISNHCHNQCLYCGFNHSHDIERKKLTMEEIDLEARAMAATGMRHVLLLTGEAPRETPLEYLEEAVGVLRRHFASVAIEIFPMDEDGYQRLAAVGVDGLTVYQETYDQSIYKRIHLAGKKTNYRYRLETPERGARAGFRALNIGALFGLGPVHSEAFALGMHAKYLEDNFLDTEVSVSMPRLNQAEGNFEAALPLDDRTFVQFLLAFRLFLPRAGIVVSTRERAEFRDRLLHLGATRFSAGSCTEVGGYAAPKGQSPPQFEICDERPVPEVAAAIRNGGYQPVFKDWEQF